MLTQTAVANLPVGTVHMSVIMTVLMLTQTAVANLPVGTVDMSVIMTVHS